MSEDVRSIKLTRDEEMEAISNWAKSLPLAEARRRAKILKDNIDVAKKAGGEPDETLQASYDAVVRRLGGL